MTKIYERSNGKIYSREMGSPPDSRIEESLFAEDVKEYLSWCEYMDIIKVAKDNPTLQKALDHVKLIYDLSKKNKNYGI